MMAGDPWQYTSSCAKAFCRTVGILHIQIVIILPVRVRFEKKLVLTTSQAYGVEDGRCRSAMRRLAWIINRLYCRPRDAQAKQ